MRSLVAGPSPGAAGDLAGHGVEYVVLPAPADGNVASALDATTGLTQASAENRSTRAWQVERAVDPDAVEGPDSWLRTGLLVRAGPRDPRRRRAGRAHDREGETMTTQPGRRSATGGRGGLSSTAVLGLLLPAVTVGMLLLVQPHEPVDSPRPPEPTTLKSASVACPSAPDGAGQGGAGSAFVATGQPDVRGEVSVTAGGERVVGCRFVPARVTSHAGAGPVVAEGEGDLAPGLIGARFGDRRLAAVDCPLPRPETWFTGVGAGTRPRLGARARPTPTPVRPSPT